MGSRLHLVPPLCAPPAPALRWAGGKQRLAPGLAARLLPSLLKGGRYFEPFLGGAAVFLELRAHGWRGEAILGDVLVPLITTFRAVRDCPDLVAAQLARFGAEEGTTPEARKAYYLYDVREEFNRREEPVPWLMAARVLYLLFRGFNALWRTNRKGKFNTPWGGMAGRGPLPDAAHLELLSRELQTSTLLVGDFAETLVVARAGDTVYSDSPYDGTYAGYAGGFSAGEQERLARELRAAHERGVHVVASNADTEYIRALYSWARIESIEVPYLVGGGKGPRKKSREVIISAEGR